jgi:hypothetical protein
MKLILLLALSVASQSTRNPKPEECPMRAAHTQMNERGEKGMGLFSQTATTHHFYLNESGGIIQVEANESTDVTNRDDIRMHLRHIAHAFQTGDFDIPMFVRDTVPPGIQEMKRLQKHIRYVFEETPNGGPCGHIINGQGCAQGDSPFLAFPD